MTDDAPARAGGNTGGRQRRDSLQIGALLRDRRRALGLTLSEVATATGLTKGFLSDVERDRTSPSVASLVGLCEVLNLPVGDLFAPTRKALVRAGERTPIRFGGTGVSDHLLTPGRGMLLQAIWSQIEPGGSGGDELYALRAEEEFVLVLAGELALTIEGETFVLAPGDAMTFDPRRRHSFRNPSATMATTALFVLTPPPR